MDHLKFVLLVITTGWCTVVGVSAAGDIIVLITPVLFVRMSVLRRHREWFEANAGEVP